MQRIEKDSKCARGATAIALVASILSAGAFGAEITVGASGCDYSNLQTAVDNAQSTDELQLRAQTFTANVDIDKVLTLRGGFENCGDEFPGLGLDSTLQGVNGAGDSVVEIAASITVKLTGLVITGGESDGAGGGLDVRDSSFVYLSNVTITGNESANGGGIYLDSSARLFRIGALEIRDNTAQKGGGIYASDSAIIDFASGSLQPVTIDGNLANGAGEGGGIYLAGGAELVTDGNGTITISNNDALTGGGIQAEPDARVASPDLILDSNSAASGGGLYIAGPGGAVPTEPQVFLGDDSLIGNNTAFDGGGVFLDETGGHYLRFEGRMDSNESAIDGGCVYLAGPGEVFLTTASVNACTAVGRGGAVYATAGNIRIQFVGITSNQASNGGAVYIDSASLELDSPDFYFNRATNNGGAIYLLDADLNTPQDPYSIHLTFADNMAEEGHGGAVYAQNSNLLFHWTLVGFSEFGNSAPLGTGGGIHATGSGDLTLVNSSIVENDAVEGGGIYRTGSGRLNMSAEIVSDAISTVGSTEGVVASGARGGIDCDPSSLDANRYCSEVIGNTATQGGGIYIQASSDEIEPHEINHTAFMNNAGDLGSAVTLEDSFNTRIEAALFTGNSDAGEDAVESVIHVIGDSDLVLKYSTIVDNSEVGLVVASTTGNLHKIRKNIFWGNPTDFSAGSGITIDNHCNMSEDGSLPGISGVPAFMPTARGQYRLGDTSDALDIDCLFPTSMDLDGISRPIGDHTDLGAFEGAWGDADALFSDRFEQ